jgi:arylsulfatase A
MHRALPIKISPGTLCRQPAMTIDVVPTLAKLAGAALPSHKIDGLDIWPLLAGQAGAESPHEAFYFFWNRELQALRSGKWKLHFPYEYATLAGAHGGQNGKPTSYKKTKIGLSLYDLEADPAETVDVAKNHLVVLQRLQTLGAKIRADLGDSATKQEVTGVRPARRD